MFRIRARNYTELTGNENRRPSEPRNRSSLRTQTNHDGLNSFYGSRSSQDTDGVRNTHSELRVRFSDNIKVKDPEISNLVFDNHANGNFKCSCEVCEVDSKTKKEEKLPDPTLNFFHKFKFEQDQQMTEPEKDFVFILRKLIPPKKFPYSVRVSIPETVAFVDGDAKFIVTPEKDRKLSFIRSRERLTLGELRKFFQDTQKRKEIEISLLEEKEHPTRNTEFLNRRETLFIDGSLDQTYDQPNFTNRSKTKRKISRNIQFAEKSNTNEIALIKFKDDSTTILTEVELSNVLLRRKNDTLWLRIQYIQMYISTKGGINSMKRVYFVYEREKEHPLFERSRIEVQYLNGEIPKASHKYIPLHEEEKFEEELRYTDQNTYHLYLLMKIYHFLDVIHGIRIKKMGGDFIQDPYGTIWLMNISRLQYEHVDIPQSMVEEEFQLADVFDQIRTESKESLILDNLTSQQFYSLAKQDIHSILTTDMMEQPERPKPRLGINSNNTELENPLLTQENVLKSNDQSGVYKFYTPQTNFQLKFPPSRPGTSQQNTAKSGRGNLTQSISIRNRSPLKVSRKQSGETIKLANLNIQPPSKLLFSTGRGQSLSRERPSALRSTDFTLKGLNNTTMTSRRGPSVDRTEIHEAFTLSTNRNMPPVSRRTVGSRGFSCRKERQQAQPIISENHPSIIENLDVEIRIDNDLPENFDNLHQNTFISVKAGGASKRIQVLDMSRNALSGRKHVQWLKDLNNSIRNRIASQLSGRLGFIDPNSLTNKNEGFPSI